MPGDPRDPSDVGAAKRELRQRLRRDRRGRVPDPTAADRLARAVLRLPEVGAARTVAAYVSGPGEPPTSALIAALAARGVRVLLPVVLPDLDLDWALDDGMRLPGTGPGALEPGGPRLGTGAVAGADVLVVPAMAVDLTGARLGQGGGSYDRALARAAPAALVVALVHRDELLDDPVPVADHDRPVDAVVTVARTVRFSGPAPGAARRGSPP